MRGIIGFPGFICYLYTFRNAGGNFRAPRLLFQIAEHLRGSGFADAGSAIDALQKLPAVGDGRHIGAGAV